VLNGIKMNLSMVLLLMLILGIVIVFPTTGECPSVDYEGSPSLTSPTTYVSAINPSTGNRYFNYTDANPPPTTSGYPLGYILINITITNVNMLAGWQVNLTWDPTILKLAVVGASPYTGDLKVPSDHVFHYDATPAFLGKTVDNTVGTLFWGCGVMSPRIPPFNGSGTACIIKLNVTQAPPPTRKCNLTIVTTGNIRTKLMTLGGVLIPFTKQDGYYEYAKICMCGGPFCDIKRCPPRPFRCTRCESGDIDRNDVVNYLDLYILAKAYGSKSGDPNWNAMADLNCDNKVNYLDLYILAKHYGQKT